MRSGPGGSGTGTGTPGPGPVVVTSSVRIVLDDGGSLVARGRPLLDDRGVLPARSRASAVGHRDGEDDRDRNDDEQEDEEPDWHRLPPGPVFAPYRRRIRHLSSLGRVGGCIPRPAAARNSLG